MNKMIDLFLRMPGILLVFLFAASSSAAQNSVVVVPLGSTVGNATAADVVKGKTFSSKAAGKGSVGTLEIREGSTIYTNSIGMKFSLIPKGSFVMGSPDGIAPTWWPEEGARYYDENQHIVTLSEPFYMQITEVTNGNWNAIIVDKGRGQNPSSTNTGENYPVENLNWYEAISFANWLSYDEGLIPCYNGQYTCSGNLGNDFSCISVILVDGCTGYRLPTEAQWEYAARSGTVSAFYSGGITNTSCDHDPNLDKIGWYCGNADSNPHPVAQKEPNSWGLYDMAGNVWEWCEDWYGTYPTGPVTDYTGPSSGSWRVVRGGGWEFKAEDSRSAKRDRGTPGSGHYSLGLRLILSPGQ